MNGMTFEMFVYKAQCFAVKWQASNAKTFWGKLKIGMGGQITMFLMSACFARTYALGEQQCRNLPQKSAIGVIKKSEPMKPNAQSAKQNLRKRNKK
jgi:hypothetical protein